MKIDYFGASRTTTGSMYLIEVNGKKLLLECGLFQGHRQESEALNKVLPFDTKQVDAVVLSHSHLDHALSVYGCLALAPQRLARAAVVPGLTGRDCLEQRFLVHVRDHQHVAGLGVGCDTGHEPVGAELRRERKAFLDRFGRGALCECRLLSQDVLAIPRGSAVGPAHHGDETHLLLGIFPEAAEELGRDGRGAGLLDTAY